MNRVELINHLKGILDLISQEKQLEQVYNKVAGEKKAHEKADPETIIRKKRGLGLPLIGPDLFLSIFLLAGIGFFVAFPFVLLHLHRVEPLWFPFMKDSKLIVGFFSPIFRLFRDIVLWILFGLALILCIIIFHYVSFDSNSHPALEKQCNILNIAIALFPIGYFLIHKHTALRIPIAVESPWYFQILKGFVVWTIFCIIYHTVVMLSPMGKKFKEDDEINKKILAEDKEESVAYYQTALKKIQDKHAEIKNRKERALNLRDSSGNYILNPHYWNMDAIAMFIQYLEHERCYALGGPGGAYNLYEQDKVRWEQSRQMDAYRQAVLDYTEAMNQNAQAMGQKLDTLIANSNEIKATEEINMWFNAFNTAYTREIAKKLNQ